MPVSDIENSRGAEFPLSQDSYLGFDARSIFELINQRLNQTGIFTDQNFAGSNLTALNDSLSYVISMLLYYLNRTSSNSTFDSDDYASINTIAKQFGYKPIGYVTSTVCVDVNADALGSGAYVVPRYSSVGSYTNAEEISIKGSSGTVLDAAILYEGVWVQHPVFTSRGIENEKFTLDVSSFVDHNNIHVYVKENNSDTWEQYEESECIFLDKSDRKVFDRRFNEKEFYELTFGNGINGRKLQPGDQVQIYYLRSSGNTVEIGSNSLGGGFVEFSSPRFDEIKTDLFPNISFNSANSSRIVAQNRFTSTGFSDKESAEQIKQRAPKWLRSRFGLVTIEDFEERVQSRFGNLVQDAKVLNNEQYINNIMRYYYDLGICDPNTISRPEFSQLNWADSCNFNNVYTFVLPKNQSSAQYVTKMQAGLIKNDLEQRSGAEEIIIADPIYLETYLGRNDNNNGQLILERVPNNFRSEDSIISEAVSIIESYLSLQNTSIAPQIRIDLMNEELVSILGVQNVYTSLNDVNTSGISFVMVDPTYPDSAFTVNQNRQLDVPFVPYLRSDYFLTGNISVVDPENVLRPVAF